MMTKPGFSIHTTDILVVDDTIASLRVLTEILSKAGYKTRPVEDPEFALAAALAQPPNLILMDIRMPKISGFQLCRRLKGDTRTRDVPIIFVSALEDTEDRVHGFEAGGVDFISKPYQESEVLERVRTHLQLRYTQLHLEEMVKERTNQLENLLEERSRALDSAQEQIRLMFENSPLGIALSSISGQFLTVNTAMLNMLGVSEAELMQKKVIDFYSNPADRELIMAELREAGSVKNFGVNLVRYDGSPFFGNMNMSQMNLDDREVLLVIVDDVTNQLAAEQTVATQEERERLARELHDAVTQTLFSASVMAQAAPRMFDKNPELARQNLDQLEQLIKGALAEMRTLLLELRPDHFAEKSLPEIFELLAESTRARTQAQVSVAVDINCVLPQEVAVTLYRIAQESLNNVGKHALASQVNIDLTCKPEITTMHISDNGCGFDITKIPAGHMGVGIMRDRAETIGAEFEIQSEIGQGTEVSVSWSKLS